MKTNKFKKILFLSVILIIPEIAHATDYVVCGIDKKFPLVFAELTSTFMTLIKIAVPILLVISGMITFLKVTFSSNVEEDLKKAKTKLINSIIAAAVIFFAISIVNFAVSLVAGKNNKFMSCINCFINSDECTHIDDAGEKICPGFINDGEKFDDNCNIIKDTPEPAQSQTVTIPQEQTTEQTQKPKQTKSLAGFLFIGDSRYNGIRNQLKILGTDITVSAVDGKSAIDWLDNTSGDYSLPSNASNISIMLGVNNTDTNNMKNLLNQLHEKYPNAKIYVNSVYHIGKKYTAGYINNSQIDQYNDTMKTYCDQNSWLEYIDITTGLYDDTGYLKSEYEFDGLHMNDKGNAVLIKNIREQLLK